MNRPAQPGGILKLHAVDLARRIDRDAVFLLPVLPCAVETFHRQADRVHQRMTSGAAWAGTMGGQPLSGGFIIGIAGILNQGEIDIARRVGDFFT